MHLVTPLAAGIAGAENGTAEIYKRGTTTRANYTLQFENFVPAYTSDIALDSYGGAVAYVGELCNVVVKTQGGAVLREFVAGVQDNAVEVISQSFTGSSYDGAMSGPDQPTTLGSVLDLWKGINGGTNWMVTLPDGSSDSVSGAVANSYGLVFNVKAYGAKGDGVSFDTDAIDSAMAAASAAGGGTVYFPSGTYRTRGGHSFNGDVSLMGAGNDAVTILLDNLAATRLFEVSASPNTDRFHVIANLALSSLAPVGAWMIDFHSGSRTLLQSLYLDGTNFAASMINVVSSVSTELLGAACVFKLGQGYSAVLISATGLLRRAAFRDCRFITPANFTASRVLFGNCFDLAGCVFDGAATATGTYNCVEFSSVNLFGRIADCLFVNAAGAAVTALKLGTYSAASNFSEADNVFGSTVTAYSYVTAAGSRGAQVQLRTRELRSIFITDASATPVLPIDQYGMVVLSSSQFNPTVFSAAATPPDGARGTIVVFRTNALPGTVTAGANFLNPAAIATAQNGTYTWEYRTCIPNATVRMALLVDGRNNGVAA